jgi:hypothetical protein
MHVLHILEIFIVVILHRTCTHVVGYKILYSVLVQQGKRESTIMTDRDCRHLGPLINHHIEASQEMLQAKVPFEED